MDFYNNLKIGSKLTLGFALVVAMSLAIGVFGYLQIRSLDRSGHFLNEKTVKPLEYIGDIASDFQRLRVNIRESIYAMDGRKTGYYGERVAKFSSELDAEIKKLDAALPDAEARKMYSVMVQAISAYAPHINRMIELSKSGRDKEAAAYLQSAVVSAAEHNGIDAIENMQMYLVMNSQTISEQNTAETAITGRIILIMAFCLSLLAMITAYIITRSITAPLKKVLDAISLQQVKSRETERLVEAIAGGDLDHDIIISEPLSITVNPESRDEADTLLKAIASSSEVQSLLDSAFSEMTRALRDNRNLEACTSWFKNGHNELNTILRGDKSIGELTDRVLVFVTEYIDAGVGVFYVADDNDSELSIAASYAFTRRKRLNERIVPGEGVAGQAVLERKMICLGNVPPDYLQISSGIGVAEPINIVVLPLLHNDKLVGMLELGSIKVFSDNHLEFLNQSKEAIAIALSVNRSRKLVNELLEQAQSQSEELRVQQEELQQINEELEERTQMLEQQREQIRAKNREVEKASRELQHKAEELEKVSAYKSEFLANMSHELRTPLNSLMILSSLLKDNRDGNLTEKQVEFAATINGAGRDLLNLINDILDLSKIESGHMEFHLEKTELTELSTQLEATFTPIAADKGIDFVTHLEDLVPQSIVIDGQRTLQILKNLLSNACKFTAKGGVSLRIYVPDANNPLKANAVAFAVSDTGIGIPPDKQSLVFNAFQQADGSTSRTYGGTGLGLSISRQLARSMNGEITLKSEAGKGSTFTLYLPATAGTHIKPQKKNRTATLPTAPPVPVVPARQPETKNTSVVGKSFDSLPALIPDDRDSIYDGAKFILVIEDDLVFAGILVKMVREHGFLVIVATDGESGIAMAERYQPNAVILDIMLPKIDGWGVMRSLKDNPVTRHIPVHFITCLEDRQKAMSMGAIGFVTKPVSSEQMENVFGTLENAIQKTMKMLLIVEDDPDQANALVALLEERNVTITVADSGAKAIELLAGQIFDCIVLDLGLADMGAFELLEELKKLHPGKHIPVIIHTGRELTHEDERQLHHYAESIIIKGAKSPERLLNEVTLFLHLVEKSLDPDKQRMIRAALDKEAMLEGKKILIVDDDMRNIFSLSSALSEKNIKIFEAENGIEALRQLDEFPDVDLVLMDIMMPEMDGYEAMRAIRKDPRFHDLPIIALTAKAMKGDREECLKAGASDYIPKPVDIEKLFSLLRVWMYSSSRLDTVEFN